MDHKAIIQCNLGRSWGAQHLLSRQAEELDAAICLVSEPANVPSSPFWMGSLSFLDDLGEGQGDLGHISWWVEILMPCPPTGGVHVPMTEVTLWRSGQQRGT